jgi:hypothetical protein
MMDDLPPARYILEAEVAWQLALLRQGGMLTPAEHRLLDDPSLYAVVVQVVARTLERVASRQEEGDLARGAPTV